MENFRIDNGEWNVNEIKSNNKIPTFSKPHSMVMDNCKMDKGE
jgi:hypothetical protein